MDVTKYSKLGMDKIRESSILNEKDTEIVNGLSKELQRVFEVKQIYRTRNEILYSVLSELRFPTPQSKYWQCIREQDSMFSELIRGGCEYEKLQGELELLEISRDEIPNDKRSKARHKIINAQIKGMEFNMMSIKLMAHDRIRELQIWEEVKQALLKEYDINIEDPNDGQYESLKKRWEFEVEIAKQNQKDSYKNGVVGLATMDSKILKIVTKTNKKP